MRGGTQRADETEGSSVCSICLSEPTCPVGTNCGHKFCAQCILTHWQHDRWPNACRCPMCRRDVTLLMGAEAWNTLQHRNTFNDVTNYNQRVSTTNAPGLLQRLLDLPAVCRYLYHDMFRLGGLPVCSRLYIIMVLVIAVIYLISPLDIIPEGILGIFGLADDIFVFVVALLFSMGQYRQYVGGQ